MRRPENAPDCFAAPVFAATFEEAACRLPSSFRTQVDTPDAKASACASMAPAQELGLQKRASGVHYAVDTDQPAEGPSTPQLEHFDLTPAARKNTAVLTTRVTLYWVQHRPIEKDAAGRCMTKVAVRLFAEGAPLLTILGPASGRPNGVEICWAWQSVLAGEVQYTQLMHTLWENLTEAGHFPGPPRGALPPWMRPIGAPFAQGLPLPDDLKFGDSPQHLHINVHLGDTHFFAEGVPTAGDAPGCGVVLADALLSKSLVRFHLTADPPD